MNKYRIPNYYRKAEFFFPTNLQNYEGGRKLLLEENKNYEEIKDSISKEFGETVQTLYEKEGFILGIHRANITDEQLFNSYFVKGLKNSKLEYDNTISVYKFFPSLLNNIINCENNWKNSKGCLLILIPKEPYTPFYHQIKENGKINNYILPTYIHSYVKVKNKEIVDIICNPNYGKRIESTGDITYDEYIVRKAKIDKELEDINKRRI